MIRYASAPDHAAIAQLNDLAFARPDEARLVERLRGAGDVLFELVSETDGQINGHVLFSRLWVDSHALYAALAPMAVRPGVQRQGVGSALVRASLQSAREFGAHGVLVLGHPAYYPRFGFRPETAGMVTSPYSGNAAFMGLELEDGAFSEPLTVAYSDAFSG